MFGVVWVKGGMLTSNYRDPWLDSTHDFPSLGYGSKQILPVITQLAYCGKGDIVLVEEPEISLHPRYQTYLPVLFGRAIKEGKQVLVTTHSSYFPASIDQVLEGYKLEGQTIRGEMKYNIKLDVDSIKVYHVERDEEGYTSLEELEIDEKGLKEGIPSFMAVEKDILDRISRQK